MSNYYNLTFYYSALMMTNDEDEKTDDKHRQTTHKVKEEGSFCRFRQPIRSNATYDPLGQ